MKTSRHALRRTILGLAMAAAFGPAHGQEAEQAAAAALKRPASAVSWAAGSPAATARDRSIWGQYNGLRGERRQSSPRHRLREARRRHGDLDDCAVAVGLDSRDIGFVYQRQGDWRIGLDYSELVHREIRTINTGMLGAGTTTPTVVLITPGTGQDLNLEMKRKAIGLAGDKWISSGCRWN